MSRELKIEIAIHTACWLLVLTIPFVFIEHSDEGLTFNWFRYGHHCVVISACAIVVYINYLYLLPKILFQRKRTALFWVVNVILIVSLALSLTLAFSPDAGIGLRARLCHSGNLMANSRERNTTGNCRRRAHDLPICRSKRSFLCAICRFSAWRLASVFP